MGRATGQGELFPVLVVLLGAVTLLRGRPAAAAELLDGAVEAARLSGNTQVLALNLLNRAHAVLAAGDVETALALAEESVELGRGLDASLLGHWASEALAAALLESGDPARAAAVLVAAAGGEDLASIPGAFRVSALELLTRCRLALGRLEDAERAAERAAAAAAGGELRLATAMARRAAAAVALAGGDPAAAAGHALAAAAAAEDAGVPIEAALARTLAGRALAARRGARACAGAAGAGGRRARALRRAALARRGRA